MWRLAALRFKPLRLPALLFDSPVLVFPLKLFLFSAAFTFDCPVVVFPLLPTTPRAVMFPLLPTTPPPPRPPRKLLRFKLLARALSRKHWRQNLARDDAVCLPQPSVAQAMCVPTG